MLARLRRARADVSTMNRLLPAAERLARDEGLERPAAEHLLLAALDLDDGIAAAALAEVGVDRTAVHDALREIHAEALRTVGVVADDAAIDASLPTPLPPAGLYRAEASARDLFQRAVAIAKAEGGALTSGHVVLAALEAPRGTAARALGRLGLDRERLEGIVRQATGGSATTG